MKSPLTDHLARIRRVVIKVGSAVLASAQEGLRTRRIARLVREIQALWHGGRDVVLVSSGAIAAGWPSLGLPSRVRQQGIVFKQMAAAVGQGHLMAAYERRFRRWGIPVAQILLTREDFQNRARFLNARNTLLRLLRYRVLPIVNENDTVSVDEIRFGDNDILAGLVTRLVDADLLIILTDTPGLYTEDPRKNPRARLIPLVESLTEATFHRLGASASQEGTGGMLSKVQTARDLFQCGIPTVIASGIQPGALSRLFQGDAVGTLFLPRERIWSGRQFWILYGLPARGRLFLDAGACEALIHRGKSLLPSGIVELEGDFQAGDAVECVDPSGKVVAKGLVNYDATAVARIRGHRTSEIVRILGYKDYDEVIHRDNLVVFHRG